MLLAIKMALITWSTGFLITDKWHFFLTWSSEPESYWGFQSKLVIVWKRGFFSPTMPNYSLALSTLMQILEVVGAGSWDFPVRSHWGVVSRDGDRFQAPLSPVWLISTLCSTLLFTMFLSPQNCQNFCDILQITNKTVDLLIWVCCFLKFWKSWKPDSIFFQSQDRYWYHLELLLNSSWSNEIYCFANNLLN